MERRALLSLGATAAAVSFAGCSDGGESSDDGGNSETTESAEPIESSAEELVFSLGDFGEAGWVQANEEIEGNMARRQFVNQDGAVDQFYATVWYYESESEAEDKYQQLNAEATESASSESRDVGSEAFAYEAGRAIVVFRDVNVVGKAEHYGTVSGSIDTATEYANMLHSKWRS